LEPFEEMLEVVDIDEVDLVEDRFRFFALGVDFDFDLGFFLSAFFFSEAFQAG
jgi:hypothetical protein